MVRRCGTRSGARRSAFSLSLSLSLSPSPSLSLSDVLSQALRDEERREAERAKLAEKAAAEEEERRLRVSGGATHCADVMHYDTHCADMIRMREGRRLRVARCTETRGGAGCGRRTVLRQPPGS